MGKDAWGEEGFARGWDVVNAARDNPDRANQLDLLITLLERVGPDDCWMLDLGSGSGQVETLIFERIPHARVACLDSSEEMLKLASERLEAYGDRYHPFSGDMNCLEAVEFPHASYAAVFSSQALHEIPHESKRAVYEKVFELLRPEGAFYILDRIEPRFDDLPDEYERVWDRLNRDVDRPMSFDEYRERYDSKGDYPASLDEQLAWLKAAGFLARALVFALQPRAHSGAKALNPHSPQEFF